MSPIYFPTSTCEFPPTVTSSASQVRYCDETIANFTLPVGLSQLFAKRARNHSKKGVLTSLLVRIHQTQQLIGDEKMIHFYLFKLFWSEQGVNE